MMEYRAGAASVFSGQRYKSLTFEIGNPYPALLAEQLVYQ
jgi:hypothetical protein